MSTLEVSIKEKFLRNSLQLVDILALGIEPIKTFNLHSSAAK